MGRPSAASQLLDRLERDTVRIVAGRDRVVLAFSGGLGSLLVAAVARKHTEIRGVVVGVPHAADREAALVARQFLDYPVDILQPSSTDMLLAAQTIHQANPILSSREVLDLVPLSLVRHRQSRDLVVSGFGLTWPSVAVRNALRSELSSTPCLEARGRAAPSRNTLLRTAAEVGIPESFAHAAPRRPAEGSGVGPAMRALARGRRISVPRLLESGSTLPSV